MTLRRWQRLVAGQVSIRGSRTAHEMFQARRLLPRVEAARGGLVDVQAAELAKVVATERELAMATIAPLVYGPMAEGITGRSMAELHRMAGDGQEHSGREPDAKPPSL
jgi:hypothetical protein